MTLAETKRKVCIVSDDFLPAMTGVGTHLTTLLPALQQAGYSVFVLTTRQGTQASEETWNGIRIYRLPTIRMFGFYQAIPLPSQIARILKIEKPNIIHHHYHGLLMCIVCRIAEKYTIPQVSTYHFGPTVLIKPLLMRPFASLIKKMFITYNNLCNHILTPSEALLQTLKQEGITTPMTHVPLPLTFGNPDTITAIHHPHSFVIMYAGRLAPEKNIPLLIDAFVHVHKKIPTTHLWIAGAGPEETKLKQRVKEYGLESAVTFLGFLRHDVLVQYYKACNTFVLPSVEEVSSSVVLEAQWFHKAVIVTSAIKPARELVTDGENGYIVPPHDPQILAQKLIAIASNPIEMHKLGTTGRRRLESHTLTSVLPKITACYEAHIRYNIQT